MLELFINVKYAVLQYGSLASKGSLLHLSLPSELQMMYIMLLYFHLSQNTRMGR